MIFVDERGGSCELVDPLRRMGLPVESVPRLTSGDLCFEGRGEKGIPTQIGIEFKKLEELVGALRTERLQGYQMVEMRQTFDHSYLLYEGEIHYSRSGMLQRKVKKAFRTEYADIPGRMTIGELLKRINVLHLCGGLNPIHTDTRADTCQQVAALYHAWTDTDLDKHKSHLAVYVAPQLAMVSDVRRTYCTLPHIGRRASLAVEQHFVDGPTAAFEASIEQWAGIQITDDKGNKRRLGIKAATDIVNYCRGLR